MTPNKIRFNNKVLKLANLQSVKSRIELNKRLHYTPASNYHTSSPLRPDTKQRNQLKGYKTRVTNAYKRSEIGEAERAMENKRIDVSRAVLN